MKARELDVVITKITRATVKYTLFIGGREEEWRVPNASTFDLSRLQEGKRYKVWTKTIMSNEVNWRKQQSEVVPRYEWFSVQELAMQARSTTRTAKQSAAAKALASMPWADDGTLFKGF